ncbi:ShlB/FhaC/HecB family hemolysin secretion/activation protein [Erwinia sorbitola]|uniref:ShlB/FhaC/HecB family hemolysin secretion/activation protein n=1 Tax=Erwinia sorbitola TaxID=2681984 RepID=A0A6I6EI62_9GAMM|nr:ShlB/FhaC/HecB family hemolysin secretion/activation protein [Erwinia sorbitola]
MMLTTSAKSSNTFNNLEQQNVHQRQQQKALQSQLDTTGKEVRGEDTRSADNMHSYVDTPSCKLITNIIIDKDPEIPSWYPLQRIADEAKGHCMNAHNIKVAIITLQNKLIGSGYITSRVNLPDQNINSGNLELKVIAGKVGEIYLSEKSDTWVTTRNAFPMSSDDILDLRDIEQGLENMQNIPSTYVHINLVPTAEQGVSDVSIDRAQDAYWRVAGWMDDAGSKYTGRYQGGLALYLDNITSLNDLFYVSVGKSLQNNRHKGNKNSSMSYSVPYGYWSLNLYASQNEYHQPLSGELSNYQYQGKSKYLSARVNRVLHRSARQKTTFSSQVIKRDSNYYISDTELELQRLDLTNLRFDLAHRHYIRDMVFDADLSWQKNMRWFGSETTASARYGNASDSSHIMTLDLQAAIPFQFAGIGMSYQPHFFSQYAPGQLISQDQFSIGNRWTIRGFDGENTLMGDRGWYLSNTVNINLPESWSNQFYLGADVGQVSRTRQDWISGRTLMGGVAGVRGYKWHTGYDLFTSVPLSKPDGLATNDLNLGFTLQWMY